MVVVFGMVASLAFGQFQGFEWGVSQEDVIAKLGEPDESYPY
jgi:hypothetical protein